MVKGSSGDGEGEALVVKVKVARLVKVHMKDGCCVGGSCAGASCVGAAKECCVGAAGESWRFGGANGGG